METLSTCYYCFAVNLPGLREKNPDLESPSFEEDIVRSLSEFIQNKHLYPCALLGHSFGAKLAVKLSHMFTFPALVLFNPSGFSSYLPFKQLLLKKSSVLTSFLIKKRFPLKPNCVRSFLEESLINKNALSRDLVMEYTDFLIKGGTHPLLLFRKMASLLPLSDSELSKMRASTLIIAGEQDPLIPPRTLYRSGLIPNVKTIFLPKTGHVSPLEAPKECASLIHNFVTSHALS